MPALTCSPLRRRWYCAQMISVAAFVLAVIAIVGLSPGDAPAAPASADAAFRLVVPAVAMDGMSMPATYVVQPGDNLYAIALRYGTNSGAMAFGLARWLSATSAPEFVPYRSAIA